MPEPPLLLADRVMAIEGEPGSMGLGTIWTETDVRPGAWYLHDGRMPAGIMIEAGQADLLLISWLGVDFLNKGERVYRLLGCELTYHGGLARARARRCATTSTSTATRARATCGSSSSTTTAGSTASPRLERPRRTGRASSPTRSWPTRAACSGTRRAASTRPDGAPRSARRRLGASASSSRDAAASLLPRAACREAASAPASSAPRTHVADAAHPGGRDAAARARSTSSIRAGGPWGRGYLRAALGLHAGRLVLRRPLQERPVHAGHADVRGLPAGDGAST